MKTVYVDSNFMCHVTDSGAMLEVQTDAFDDLCDNAIELMRLVPQGYMWERRDGRAIRGLFIQATDSAKIDEYQRQAKIDDMEAALALLGVSP